MEDKNAHDSCKKLLNELLEQQELLKIILSSLEETLANFTKSKVETGKPYFKENTNKANIEVAGLIRFESTDLAVELFLGLSSELFFHLYQCLFFTATADEISQENHDLAGEILNVAFGSMDPKLRKLGRKMRSSLPIIYSGENLQRFLGQIGDHAIVIPYTISDKILSVQLYSANSFNTHWTFTTKLAS